MDETPNFRIGIKYRGEETEELTTLRDFLANNEGSSNTCALVKVLEPGQQITLMAGELLVRRFPQAEVRYSHFKVPVKFDGTDSATVTIDRKRLIMSIRPLRRRRVVEFGLTELVEQLLWKQIKLDLAAKKKERRKARLARRK